MRAPVWRIDDEDGDPEVTGSPRPLLVTGRAIRGALQRTWRIWVGAALVGGLLGLGAIQLLPHGGSATTTLLMVHPDAGDASAMSTDLSLLQTRVVAAEVVQDLHLPESPIAFLSSVTAEPVNSQILEVSVTAGDDAAAVARARSLVDNFLEFRARQLRSISQGLIEGYQVRVKDLQSQADALSKEYDRLSAAPKVDQVRAAEVITSRADLGTQITTMQRAIEAAGLQTDAAITATHVIDTPVAMPYGSRRQLVLFAASGAILAGALAIAIILFQTLTSDRLRQRREIAAALGVQVRVGVGPVPAPGALRRAEAALTVGVARLLRGHPVRWTARRRNRNLDALVQGLESALPERRTTRKGRRGQKGSERLGDRGRAPVALGVAAIDRADTTAVVVRALGERLRARGASVLLVDLSSTAALSGRHTGLGEPEEETGGSLRTYRPPGEAWLAAGPRNGGQRVPGGGEGSLDLAAGWHEADTVIVLLEVDPGIDLDILRTWFGRLVPVVTAGRASHELLSTISALVAAVPLEMPFALVEGVDGWDESLGAPDTRLVEPVPRFVERR